MSCCHSQENIRPWESTVSHWTSPHQVQAVVSHGLEFPDAQVTVFDVDQDFGRVSDSPLLDLMSPPEFLGSAS